MRFVWKRIFHTVNIEKLLGALLHTVNTEKLPHALLHTVNTGKLLAAFLHTVNTEKLPHALLHTVNTGKYTKAKRHTVNIEKCTKANAQAKTDQKAILLIQQNDLVGFTRALTCAIAHTMPHHDGLTTDTNHHATLFVSEPTQRSSPYC